MIEVAAQLTETTTRSFGDAGEFGVQYEVECGQEVRYFNPSDAARIEPSGLDEWGSVVTFMDGTEWIIQKTPDELAEEIESEKGSTGKVERLRQASLVIEEIAASNAMLPKQLDTETEERLSNAIDLIYRLAHVARVPDCMSAHPRWENEFQELVEWVVQ